MKEIIELLKEKFGEMIKGVEEKHGKRIYVAIEPEKMPDAAKLLFEQGLRFSTASALQTHSGFEVIYHFSHDKEGGFVNLRVNLPEDNPSVPSITPVICGAEWIEREMHEMLGIDFPGHPNLAKLLLPEDWEEGNYPLRRK